MKQEVEAKIEFINNKLGNQEELSDEDLTFLLMLKLIETNEK